MQTETEPKAELQFSPDPVNYACDLQNKDGSLSCQIFQCNDEHSPMVMVSLAEFDRLQAKYGR